MTRQPANHINRAKPCAPNEVFEAAGRQEKSDRIHREMSCVRVQEGGRKQSIPFTELQNEIWHQSTKGHQGEGRRFKQIDPWTDTVDELGHEYAGQRRQNCSGDNRKGWLRDCNDRRCQVDVGRTRFREKFFNEPL
jgi:hypothetical protein